MESTNRTGTPAVEELRRLIAMRAYEIYELRGGGHGNEAEDWFRAEREILAALGDGPSADKKAVSIAPRKAQRRAVSKKSPTNPTAKGRTRKPSADSKP